MTEPSHNQKSLRLEVPDYPGAGKGKAPRTYLQLGAFPTEGTARDRGDDLLDRVGLTAGTELYFADDYRHDRPKAGSSSVDPPAHGQQHPQVTYWRDDGRVLSQATPRQLTQELRTRGGWRLHTDGNYVSTTRGDRVDVIGGNYQLCVLGRTDAEETGSVLGSSFWEISGGHLVTGTNYPGARVSVAWNEEHDTWRVVTETMKGDCIERYEGIVEEVFTGKEILSFMGFDPTAGGSTTDGTTPPPPELPRSAASDAGGAHTQTDQDTCWINPSSGPGNEDQPGWPRTKHNPVVDETVEAATITETVVSPTISRSLSAQSKKEIFSAWGGALLDTTDAVADGATYAIARGTQSRPTGHHYDLKFCAGILATEMFETFQESGSGHWSFNLNLVAGSLEAEIYGAKAVIALGRYETSFFYGKSYEASLAARLSVQVGGELTFKMVETLEAARGLHRAYGLVEIGAMLIRKRAAAIKERQTGGIELETRAQYVGQ